MKKKRFAAIVVLIVGVYLVSALQVGWAAPEEAASSGGYLSEYSVNDPRPSPVSWWSTLIYLFSLLVVFAIVVILAYMATRFLGSGFALSSTTGGRLLEQLAIGPKHSVCAIDMADRVFIVGVADQSVSLLVEITDKDEIDRLRRQSLTRPLSGGAFEHQLGALSGLMKKISPVFRK